MRAFVAAALLTLSPFTLAQAREPASLVFVNGAVYTMNAARSRASALAVSGEHISYVGDDAGAQAFIGPHTRLVDLHGRMLLPGFQDSHVHPGFVANPDTYLQLDGLIRAPDVLARIGQFTQTHPDAAWIRGGGWDEAAFLPSGLPYKHMLDRVTAQRPAYLVNNSHHRAWANSAALVAAGITAQTPDPPNGRIERDATGEPTGVLHEATAMALVEAVIPPPTPDEQVQNLSAALRHMSSLGITALIDAKVTPALAAAYQTLDQRGELHQRSNLCLYFDPHEDDETQIISMQMQRAQLGGKRLRATCVKLFLDGVYGSHTVALREPYSEDPQRYGKGELFIEPQRLARLVTRLDAEDFQIMFHAIGDGAVRAALDAIARARDHNGLRDNRHTLAHLSLIDPADIPRFSELGVIANMTPLWSLGDAWETVIANRLFGAERSARIFQTRTLLNAGTTLVWGSDWDVSGVSPLAGLETSTTHRYPGGTDLDGKPDSAWHPAERVSLEQAIAAYTRTSAYLMHDETRRGSLAPGMLADLVVLNHNLYRLDPLAIHAAQVAMTVLGGDVIFE